MTEQSISSEATSLNQVPALFKKVPWYNGDVNLDYGGGKYDTATEWLLENYDVENLVVDKFNRSPEWNAENFNKASRHCDTVTICNVLNVIKEDDVIDEILRDASRYAHEIYISVYEGDGNGIGRETTKGYQRNQKLREYGKFFEKHFNYLIKDGVAYCHPKKGNNND